MLEERRAGAASAARARALRLPLLPFLAVAVPLATWLPPAVTSSLWLDETGTVWLTGDGLGAAVDRSMRFQGGSPLYPAIAWAARTVGGGSEPALRLPSLLAMAAAAWMLARLGTRLFDREAGLAAAVVFVASSRIAYAAADARPYALAIAALVGAVLALVRWVDERRARDAVLAAALAAGTVAFHYLFALALVGPVLYAARRVPARRLAPVAAAVAVFSAPLAPSLLSLFARRHTLSVGVPFPADRVLEALAPSIVVVAIAAGALALRATAWRPAPMARAQAWLLVPWAVIPPAALYAVTALTSTDLPFGRYHTSAFPAIALAAGWAIRGLAPARARTAAVIALVGLSVPLLFGRVVARHSDENWRGAARAVSAIAGADTPVLVNAGFVEASEPGWLDDPEKRAYLLSPLAAYPMRGRPIPMPFEVDAAGTRYLAEQLRGEGDARRILLVTRAVPPTWTWVDGFLAARGYEPHRVGDFGVLRVIAYRR